MRLADKTAIVTGAGRGIGKAIALKLAAEGAKVVAADLSPGTAAATAEEINKAGGSARAIAVKVARREDVRGIHCG